MASEPTNVSDDRAETVAFPTTNAFVLKDILRGRGTIVDARGLLFLPAGEPPPGGFPAVVVLEGLGGLKPTREIRYGAMLAERGWAALVVDTFATRGVDGLSHNKRALRVTETMMLADAYAGLRFLAEHPAVDPDRISVIGFSYGGMIAVLAAYRQMQEVLSPEGHAFAGHVSYYGCSVARFERVETTGAPVLMLLGDMDENVSIRRSRDIAADLRRGGSDVTITVYPETYHQWDGNDVERRFVGLNLAGAAIRVGADGRVRDCRTGIEMRGPVSRILLLAAGVSRTGYYIKRNETTNAQSDRDLIGFLERCSGRGGARLRLVSGGAPEPA